MAEAFPSPFGRYQLVERLAVGGMAEVFLATVDGEHGFARKIVIKRLLPHLAAESGYTAMFIDEAKLTARLVHPKIAQTYELGKVDDRLYIAMEMVDGIDVLALLREYAHRRERLPTDLAVWIAHEVLDALEYAHNLADVDGNPMGVVHRDISPSNILLSKRGDVKLVDFGIARATEPGRHHRTKSGTLKGKYGYMSPEQVLEQQVDARSDLFSVGIVLAEMLCGRRLFAAPNELDVLLMVRDAKLSRLDDHGRHIESNLDGILRKALRKDVTERWSSAAEFRDALADWLFQQRLRVTPKKVADAVDSIYDHVWARRRADATNEQPAAQEPSAVIEISPQVAPPTAPNKRAPTTADSPRAINAPRAVLDVSESLPIITIEEPPVLEVAPPPPRARASVPPPVAPKPQSDDDVARMIAELDAMGPVADGGPVREASRPNILVPTDDEADQALEGLELGDAVITGTPESIIPQVSVRYSSITEALSRIETPDPPDPSSVEFDGVPIGDRKRPTGEVPALTHEALERARTAPPPALAEIEDTPEENGDFTVIPPLKLMYWLMSTRKTGLLVATIGAIKKEIYVRDGMPEFVSSNMSSELFGNWLVSQGTLSQGELAMALAMMPHYGGKLGDTLVGLGLLKPLEVFRHLTKQVRQKLIDVCTWNKGGFSWYVGRANPREAFPLDLNAFEVLGAGAMALSESSVDAWLERHTSAKLKAQKGKFGPDRFELPGLRALYDGLDGKRSVGEILSRFTDDVERRKTTRMLMLLELCELAKAPSAG